VSTSAETEDRRARIEGAFGGLKSSKAENIVRGWCFLWGRAKTPLLLAAAIAAANMRTLRRWAARHGYTDDWLCAPTPDDHGFQELDADGTIAHAHDPPPPAT
jgi:hypothetical protein